MAVYEYSDLEFWNTIFTNTDEYTAETSLMGRRVVFTADPENIKAMLATQFGDYGKGRPFHEQWEPFLGDGVFTTDGETWQASRQLLRPQFIRDRVSDLHTFEEHLQTLFKAIANGGALDSRDPDGRHGRGQRPRRRHLRAVSSATPSMSRPTFCWAMLLGR